MNCYFHRKFDNRNDEILPKYLSKSKCLQISNFSMVANDLVCKIDGAPIAGLWFSFVFVTTHIREHLCQV